MGMRVEGSESEGICNRDWEARTGASDGMCWPREVTAKGYSKGASILQRDLELARFTATVIRHLCYVMGCPFTEEVKVGSHHSVEESTHEAHCTRESVFQLEIYEKI